MHFQPLTITVLTLGLALVGCRKQAVTTATATPVAQPALAAWQQGDRTGAVSNFVTTDWSAGPLFAPDSILSLTEAEFSGRVKPRIPGFVRTGAIEAVRVQMTKELATMKQLAAAVAQAGRDAAATNDVALARKHFTSLQQFAAALDTTNSLSILRLDGQAIKKRAERELATLPQ